VKGKRIDGKLATRTWARGVVTTYSYDDCCAAGHLKKNHVAGIASCCTCLLR